MLSKKRMTFEQFCEAQEYEKLISPNGILKVISTFENKFVENGIDFSRAAYETARMFNLPTKEVLQIIPNKYWHYNRGR